MTFVDLEKMSSRCHGNGHVCCCRRKYDTVGPHNLFSLLTERLLLNTSQLTMATYNALFEVCT